jgi:DNA (cytosine-5)-methyltransferase 1
MPADQRAEAAEGGRLNVGLRSLRVLSVCTGGAGLDRGLGRAEPSARTVCYVEVEAFACAILVAQMEAGTLDRAPVWSDARTFDGRAWRGAVDCVVAGFPCQDISSAGKRAGIQGSKSEVWFDVARIVRDVRPRIVFLENVDDLVIRGIDTVLGHLAEMGFAACWGVFSAAEVGAPHLRERIFILAVAEPSSRGQRELWQPSWGNGQPDGSRQAVDDTDAAFTDYAIRPGRHTTGRAGTDVEYPDSSGRGSRIEYVWPWREQPNAERASEPLGEPNGSGLADRLYERPQWLAAETGDVLADAESERLGEAWRDRRSAEEWPALSFSEFPPGPAAMLAWREVPAGLEPAVCRLADGLDVALRTDWLRLLGNGVCPPQAEHAYRTLRDRLVAEGLWPA